LTYQPDFEQILTGEWPLANEDVKKDNLFRKLIPFVLTIAVLALDQVTKAIVVGQLKLFESKEILGDFFRLTHVRNTAIAFSIGKDLPPEIRQILFIIFPLILVAAVLIFYFVPKNNNQLQRWCLAGIVGGGLGNLADRLLRPEGVVDFLDFKFFGIFGWERWPTFNIADSAVVVMAIILFISLFFEEKKLKGSAQ
jgi:signal peptidase II